MVTLTVVIHVIVSIIIIIAVLLQSGKGATMGSTFGGGASSQTVFGSAGPATMLAKVTGICAAIFMLTSLYLTYQSSKGKASIMSTVPAATQTAPQAAPTTAPPAPQP